LLYFSFAVENFRDMRRADDQWCEISCSDEEAIGRAKTPEVVGCDGLIS